MEDDSLNPGADHDDHPHETRGHLRPLTPYEKQGCPRARGCCATCCLFRCKGCCRSGYNYVVTEPYTLRWRRRGLTVPAGLVAAVRAMAGTV